MNKLTQHITGFYLVLFLILTAATAEGGTKTFPAGSYIIPQDLCWQPTKYYPDSPRPITVEICGNSYDDDLDGTTDEANTALLPYNCYNLTGCDTNKNDQGVFQSTGLIYEILTAGYPVYWIINPNKTDQIGVDLSITKSGTDPAVTILHSTSPTPKTDSGTLATVEYRGGPFMIDANDYDTAVQALFDKYLSVKLHKSNYDFSAEVDKVLSGKPPDVAVLGEGATQVLTDYLFASGLANQQAVVFKYLTTPDIIADKLADYQLLWAPHWIVDQEVPVVADRPLVLGKVRSFLESGNAGFFECASLESLERSVEGSTSTPASYITGQGILLDKNYATDFPTSNGRVEADGGTMNYNKMKLEEPTNVLTQCGGWRFKPTGGHVQNFRPNEQPDPNFVYNSTVDRFAHDDETRTDLGYTGMGYDYYVGGRINGSATQGYVAYLAGHKYVKCSNATTSSPSTRFFEMDFTASPALVPTTVIYVEAVYSGCTAGSTCPKASFDLTSQSGSYSTDGTLFVDLDSAEYVADADPVTKYILQNIQIGNKNTTTDKVLTDIIVTFDGNTTSTLLTEMRDVSITPTLVCNPNSPTPATCPSVDRKKYDLNFDTNLVNSLITFEVQYGTCTQGTTCPKGTYDTGTGAKTSGGSSATLIVDMSGVTYDATNKKLQGVVVSNESGTSKTLNRFYVGFTANPGAQLTTIQDVTTTPTTACTSNSTTTAACPANTIQPIEKNYQFRFDANIASGKLMTVEAVFAACTQGSTCPKAQLTTPNTGRTTSTYNNITVDMTGADFATVSGKYYLRNVKIKNSGITNVTITKIVVTWNTTQKLRTVTNTTDSTTVCSYSSPYVSSPATCNSSQALNVIVAPPPINVTLTAYAPLGISLAKALTECVVDWGSANACGMKYVLNTLIGLQFQVIPHEYNKAGAIQQDNILYKGAFEYPGYKGHLYSIDVKQDPAVTNWDAGKKTTMPTAGAGNPALPTKTNATRYIFTNIPGTTPKINFDVTNTGSAQTDTTKLWHYLDPDATSTLNSVKALINSVRGKKNASDVDVDGEGDVSKRLGGIEHSSTAVMTKSKLAGAADRDRVVFVGAHDGMLHAFYAGTWNTSTETYSVGSGKEIWAYIPSTLLGSLQKMTFTDCSPGETITSCVPDASNNYCVCPIFSVAVTVDGSPALGDFFVDHDNNPATVKQWRTILVATAKVMTPGASSVSVNQGIIFALDVTNPYSPSVLWERTYNAAVDTSVSPGNAIKRNYYPPSTFTTTYTTGENTSFAPNMGDAKGVAIGRVQVGTTLDTYVFLTSRWVSQVDISATATPHNVWGLSVFALDFYSGDIRWETKIAYTGDAEGVNEPPATPALLDYGNNGTYDYVVLGDMQGRLWVLKSIDGKTINSTGAPAYTVGNGANEPIGAPVAIYNNTIVFGTGGRDSLQDESTTPYHLYAIEINSKGEVTDLWTPPYALNAGEKIWSSPVIDSTGAVYVGTAKGYTDVGRPDMMSASSGRLLVLELSTGTLKKDSSDNDMVVDLGGAVIGDIAIESNHVTLQLFDGTTIQIGGGDFTSTVSQENPIKVLWWRKL